MNVRNLEIALRPRKGWEAVDLGFMLTRAYYIDLLRMGFMAFFPFFIVICVLCWKVGWLSFFLIWLLKPIYDRFYLHYFSRKIFGEAVTVKEVLMKAPHFIFKRSFSLMTILRLGSGRSMMLPIRDLEQLKGRDYRKRVGVVGRIGGSSAMMITFAMHLCEYAFLIGMTIFIGLLIPQGQIKSLDELAQFFVFSDTGKSFSYMLSALLYGVIIIILEPFYVGAGFSLYLNSRCTQEAWDIELRFKEFASRISKTILQKVTVFLLSWSVISFTALPSQAASEEDPQSVIKEVYQEKDFEIKKVEHWEWFSDEKEKDKEIDIAWLEKLFEWLQFIPGGEGSGARGSAAVNPLIMIMKLLGYVVLGILILAVAYVLFRLIINAKRPELPAGVTKLRKQIPKTIMGMDITKESLPDDVLSAARQAWDRGSYKEALSFLYRGALSNVVSNYEVDIESSDTEYECLSAAKKALPQTQGDYFSALSTQWIATAYSRKRTNDNTFLTLCNQWPF